jgi:putative heme-binding domain-containing protein
MPNKFFVGMGLATLLSAIAARAAQTIVDAPPKEPAEERAAFHVPPGFEVQLVASEPDIHKPINIAFDDRGRLWVTDTVEYPFPAPEGAKTRDTVKILEDFDATGKARKITTFADNLNIPIGVLPAGDNAAIVYSIPNIWKMTDTAAAGHADKRDVLLSGFAHDDTHGMTGSFTEGFDGWIYAVHGFRNTSTVKGTDGSTITMNSGNTYRFRPDGSHVEQFTHGQVNPFGMCIDPLGNLYTSDCETKPIALMLRESYHPSFGKPDDGLGFCPEMCDHMYGSTAIAGLCDYVAEQYPAEYRNRMFVGNVVTNRINDAKLTPRGSAFHADDAPDFVTSDDGWFRPVCIKLGPDGAMYISDFYNRIIGHYEVDLHHPGRDKQRGRIWRIVYKGNDATPAPAKKFDLTQESVAQLIDDLASPNLTIRILATNRLADVIGEPAIAPLKDVLAKTTNPIQKVHVLWVLHRLGALDPAALQSAVGDGDATVREHALRILGETATWEPPQHEWAVAGLKDADPLVRRTAIEAIGRHPRIESLRPLLDLREQAGIDPFLLYTVRIALRDFFQSPEVGVQISKQKLSDDDQKALADVAVGASAPGSAAFLFRYVQANNESRSSLARYLQPIARSVPEDQVDALAKFIMTRFEDDRAVQLVALKSILDGLSQRDAKPTETLRSWGTDLAAKIITGDNDESAAWTYQPIKDSRNSRNPWAVQMRASADGDSASPFLSSLVRGETLTGVARSKAFAIPAQLSFFLAGHNGLPPAQRPIKNIVRLRDAQTDEILAEQAPPRNDKAQKVTWELSKFAGRQGYFEATDADSGTAYAWLAFGRFDPPVIQIPKSGTDLATAIQIAQSLQLVSLAGPIESVLRNAGGDPDTRLAAARALGRLDAASHVQALAAVAQDATAPDPLRDAAAAGLGSVQSAPAYAALVEAMRSAPRRLQLSFAKALAAGPGGASALLDAIAQGKTSAQLLQDLNVRERLTVAQPPDLEQRLKQLTQGMPTVSAETQHLIDQRAAAFNGGTASAARGKLVFQKNCIACHMIGGQGAHVGPQLDGIGARGVPRLCEDILDPSRNVDAAFRYSTFVLSDGNVIAGIPRREEGATLTVADSTGKEVAIQKSQITRRVESTLSLMPSNFGEVIPESDFDDLLSYLLSAK